jgi:hypothetical protein
VVVVTDALVRQQLRELLRVDEVALDLVLQVGLPVQLDGAGDVAAVVGGGVLVDSTKTVFGASRLLSAQSVVTRTSERAMYEILSVAW